MAHWRASFSYSRRKVGSLSFFRWCSSRMRGASAMAGCRGEQGGVVGASMPERVADHFDVAAALKQMGRGRMTQAVEAVAGGDANPLAGLLEGTVQGRRRDGLVGRSAVEYPSPRRPLSRSSSISFDHDGAPPDRSDGGPSKESMLNRDHRETVETSHPPARSPDLRAGTRDLPGQHARSAFVQSRSSPPGICSRQAVRKGGAISPDEAPVVPAFMPEFAILGQHLTIDHRNMAIWPTRFT